MAASTPGAAPSDRSPNESLPLIDRLRERLPRYAHDHPPVRNVNELVEEHRTPGARVADRVAATLGSWPFLITQSLMLAAWVLLNVIGWVRHWDPYPFILLNLALSLQAAYSGPVIMMSQNRQAEKDRLMAQHDYEINQKAEEEIKVLMDHLEIQHEMILHVLDQLRQQQAETRRLVEALENRGT